MSKAKGKGKSKGSSGTGASSLADTFVPLIPPDTGSDQSYLPFPEWTDQSLNAEKWDKPKGKAPTADQSDLFVDPQPVYVPYSISICGWKRLGQVFPDAKLIMFADKPEYPDLISASKHLLHSDFVRSFIAAMTTLEYLGNTNPFPIEYTTATFTPTTQDLPWRPWHHIYSMCKAGKGQKHNPQVNQLGLSSSLTNVDKGRHLFRLWLRSDTSFVLNILSELTAVIGNWERILHFMQGESERFTKLFHDVSSAYGQLVQKFGTIEYANGLRTFYTSYKSDQPLSKINSAKVHDKIIEQILKALKDIYSIQEYKKAIFAFKVLFINPYIIPRNAVFDEPVPLCDKGGSTISFVFAMSKKVENAAVIIQAFFKRIFVNKLKAYHNQNHKNYMATFLLLKKIYTDLFSVSKRSLLCASILRNVFFEDVKNEWSPFYSLFNDLLSVVHLQCISGLSEFKGNAADWVYMTRVTFHCNSPEPILVKIQLFCMLPHFMVRVFDNDTDREMYRFTNNVNVQNYNINENGYSVLCYGWSETNDPVQWKLCFATIKKKDKSLIILSELKPELNFLCGVYIPNYANRLFRCKIVTLKTTLFSCRLSVSCSTAKITLKLLDENDRVMGTIEDYGCAIFPVKNLVFVPQTSVTAIENSSPSVIAMKKGSKVASSKSITFLYSKKENRRSSEEIATSTSAISYTTYFVEGYVIEDSWELLPEEWEVADEAKMKRYLHTDEPEEVVSSTAVARKSSKRQSQLLVEKRSSFCSTRPFWLLHFIAEEPENIVVAEDRTRDLEIANSKKAWLLDDPERAQRGIMLRLNYLISLQKQEFEESEGWEGEYLTLELVKRKRFPPVKETASEIYKDYLLPEYEDEDGDDLPYSERSREVMTEENIQEFLLNHQLKTEEYQEMLFNSQSNLSYLIAELKNRREFMKLWLEEVRNESMELLKDALAIRQRYIDWLIKEEESKVPPPKSGGKEKDKKKDKKGKKK
ncbi:uncharacterized protein LOC108741701 [Agrilus planipennis]|uniref:Uncharacterized protein LOC108741701 n=1 Tax=Agrilus planipennis TaxID=224129 RepID=A0A7F5RD79_AGRPL|nr:uncharacterized protein LOC108741701 [Agrilus planipennis]